VSNDFRAMRLEISVAKPAMLLSTGIDDMRQRFVGHASDQRIDALRAFP
jgi:hypothetical protein